VEPFSLIKQALAMRCARARAVGHSLALKVSTSGARDGSRVSAPIDEVSVARERCVVLCCCVGDDGGNKYINLRCVPEFAFGRHVSCVGKSRWCCLMPLLLL